MKRIEYVRASLLDRLIDENPKQQIEAKPLRAQTHKQLRAALLRDLTWLLNTRCPFPYAQIQDRQRTVIDYGVPDFGQRYTENREDQIELEEMLVETITAYEPRLQDVKVFLKNDPDNPNRYQQMQGSLEANLIIGDVNEPLSFPLFIQGRQQWAVSFENPTDEEASTITEKALEI